MEESDDHEGDLSEKEEGNYNNENQCGGLSIPLVEKGMETEIFLYISVRCFSYILYTLPTSLPRNLQIGAHRPHDYHHSGAGIAGAPCPGPQGHQPLLTRLSFFHPSEEEEI